MRRLKSARVPASPSPRSRSNVSRSHSRELFGSVRRSSGRDDDTFGVGKLIWRRRGRFVASRAFAPEQPNRSRYALSRKRSL